jgi:signal transduction histidine kinase
MRELDVVHLVAKGCSNHEIAQELVISEKTVKTHISNILGKLHLDDAPSWQFMPSNGLQSRMNSQSGSALLVDTSNKPLQPGTITLILVYLVFIAVVIRTLAMSALHTILPRYLGFEFVFLVLYSLVLWKPRLPHIVLHLYLVLQSVITFRLLAYWPEFDFIVLLFLLLIVQVSLYFTGRTRWVWVGVLVFLTGGSLVFYHGWLYGLALSLSTMAAEIVMAGYIIAMQTIASSQRKSQELITELQGTHQQLQLYAGQVGELASIRERNRLARELHDTVSQLIFSISLAVRSAQLLLDKDPGRIPAILASLQEMTADALRQLRSFITQLHPPQNS